MNYNKSLKIAEESERITPSMLRLTCSSRLLFQQGAYRHLLVDVLSDGWSGSLTAQLFSLLKQKSQGIEFKRKGFYLKNHHFLTFTASSVDHREGGRGFARVHLPSYALLLSP